MIIVVINKYDNLFVVKIYRQCVNNFDIYDMDIRLDIGSAKVKQVGEVKEQYGEEGYVAFLYTIELAIHVIKTTVISLNGD